MNKEFCTYEQALALKELGFDEPCFRFQNNISNIIEEKGWLNWNEVEQFVSLPLKQQAFRWLREKHDLNYEIPYAGKPGEYHAFVQNYIYGNNGNNPSVFSYEEAENVCIDKLIELCKEKNGTN